MTARIHSPKLVQVVSRWSIVAVAVSVFVCGLVWRNANLLGVGAAILCFVLRRAWDNTSNDAPNRSQRGVRKHEGDRSARLVRNEESERPVGSERDPVEEFSHRTSPPKSTDALVDDLLTNGRYALMLRPETKQHLSQLQLMRAI